MTRRSWRGAASLALCAGLAAGGWAGFESARSPSSDVAVTIAWKYRGIPKGMSIYEPAGGQPVEVWQMGSSASLTGLPVGAPIADSRFLVTPGEEKMFVLVYHNPTSHPVRFFAAPHGVSPPEHSLGFEFQCLCVNHIYTAPAHGYWYRVVRLTLDRNSSGSLEVTHNLIRAPAEQAVDF